MRYPLWTFFFLMVLPPFALHALLVGKARIEPAGTAQMAESGPAVLSGFQVITR